MALHQTLTSIHLNPKFAPPLHGRSPIAVTKTTLTKSYMRRWVPLRTRSNSREDQGLCRDEGAEKPVVCTADEVHYTNVIGTDWRIALWRYKPRPKAPQRNHPLLLLNGIGMNAIGFDLSPDVSFARDMSYHGFDTWVVEVRGTGLSSRVTQHQQNRSPSESDDTETKDHEHNNAVSSEKLQKSDRNLEFATKLSETLTLLTERFSGSDRQNSAASEQIRGLSEQFLAILDELKISVPPACLELQTRVSKLIKDFLKQTDLPVQYNWDFDHHLEEDLPAAMEYIKNYCQPKDGKLLAVGFSMGGIMLYARLSQCGFEGRDSGLAAVVTLASSLDCSSSKTSLKLFLPLADPIRLLNIPVVPLGPILAASYRLTNQPPYVYPWIYPQVSAEEMHSELFDKLLLDSFCLVSVKVLLQLTSVVKDGGLVDRSGQFHYKDHLKNSRVPVLAIAGDKDHVCPPEAVYETVKLFPKQVATYKVFGRSDDSHFAHYDIIGGHKAFNVVHPCILDFLCENDGFC